MMYKFYNWLFGWDYIQWTNTAASGVARLHVDGRNAVFYWRYKNTKIADEIKDEKKVLWLTCEPSKYLK